MRRGLLLLSTVLVAIVVVPAATADQPTWVPTREIIAAPADRVFADQCSFDVLAHIEGNEVHTTFTDKAGNPVKLFGSFPGNMLTLTNLETGMSITRPATGSFQARINPDGSGSIKVTGHGPWVPNPVTGEPGIWYQTGQVSATFDAAGNMTSIKAAGTLVDLCAELAH